LVIEFFEIHEKKAARHGVRCLGHWIRASEKATRGA